MTPLTDDEVRWLVNSHTCSLEMVGDTCRVCWLGNERAALLAENARLVAGLESIAKEGTSETADGTMLAPGALQARIVLDGSTRPLERYTEKIAALLAERDALKATADLSPDNASLEGTIAILDEWRYKENNEPFPLSGSKVRELCESVIALRAELAALKIENDEADTLNTRLSRILTDTAHVLKGTPEALHSHSWADLAQVAAAIKEKAERLHTDFRNATIMNLDVGQECEKCEKWWKYDSPIVERHAPDCPAHPDFLTTSATESREAKGGTT